MQRAIAWSRIDDQIHLADAVSRNIAAARHAKADAEARRDAKQAEHDAFEEQNRGQVRAR